jgi:hypothetical protein
MYVFAATFWTLDVAFFVFRKGKNYFKWLLAIFAVELVARHGDLRKNARAAGSGLLNYGVRSRIAGVKASGYLEGGQFPVSVNRTLTCSAATSQGQLRMTSAGSLLEGVPRTEYVYENVHVDSGSCGLAVSVPLVMWRLGCHASWHLSS